jgi:ABC-type transport system substrate-binding protein
MCLRDTVACLINRGDPIPYPLLPNQYSGQVSTAQGLVENMNRVGLNVQITMRENLSPRRAGACWRFVNVKTRPITFCIRP